MHWLAIGMCLIIFRAFIYGRFGKRTFLKGLEVGAVMGIIMAIFKGKK